MGTISIGVKNLTNIWYKMKSVFNKKLRIGPLNWDIKELPDEECLKLDGKCSVPIDASIYINPNLKGMEALETLLHESIHAIDGMRNLKLKEEIVGKLGYSIALLLYQNKWILNYAKDKINEEIN